MPIQSRPADIVDGPNNIGSSACSKMESSRSTRAMKRRNAISQKTLQESFLIKAEGDVTFDCMFCNESYKHHEALGKHVLARHRPTLCEPTVLCFDAEYLGPQDKRRKSSGGSTKKDKDDCEGSDCEVCGQTFTVSTDLETHMKKHKDSFIYSCNICGRRFKEPWFLKNHKRTHSSRTGGKNKPAIVETPITINEVVQEQVAQNVTSPYKLCKMCGFFFPDKESLLNHSKIHIKKLVTCEESAPRKEQENISKEEFMNFLHLKPSKPEVKKPEASRIGELDPFTTYQAWQLATKGKVALGFGVVKEPFFEVNMETDSEKDESSDIWNTGKMSQSAHEETDPAKGDNCVSASLSRDLHKPKNRKTAGKTKVRKIQDKTPFCTDCGKLFRTYQQLVLHSRVHKKDRNSDSESSTMSNIEGLSTSSSPDTPASVEDQETVKMEEDVGGHYLISENVADDQAICITKGSRECYFCRKIFRSSYYLNIHLRTHTGEKPYGCAFCKYAAAQKTSLRYHLERHHKFKPGESNAFVRNLSKQLQLLKKSSDCPPANIQQSKIPQKPIADTKEDSLLPKPPKRKSALRNRLVNTNQLFQGEAETTVKDEQETPVQEEQPRTPVMEISLACEEILDPEMCSNEKESSSVSQEETSRERPAIIPPAAEDIQTVPLDLCFSSRARASASLSNRALIVVRCCPYCTYKTLYPEVLITHQNLVHKQSHNKSNIRSKNPGLVIKMRRTGCPPALKGIDVSPLHLYGEIKPTPLPCPKPKRAPAQSNKAAKSQNNCKNVEQENNLQSVQQSGHCRNLQPNLQGISHLLEKMQHADQNLPAWTSSPNTQASSGVMNGSEQTYRMMSSVFAANSCARPPHSQLRESFTNQANRGMSVSASSSNYASTEVTQRLQPSQVNMHSLDGPPINPGPAVLANVPHPYENDPRWNLLLSYEQPQAEAPFASGNPSLGQESSSPVEGYVINA
ncbi:zinc finger protein 217 [Leptodactylus fuscus]